MLSQGLNHQLINYKKNCHLFYNISATNMKLLLSLFLIWPVIQNTSRAIATETFNKSIEEICAEESNISYDEIPNVFYETAIISEDDKTYKKFFNCLWGRKGIVGEDGKINAEHFAKFLEASAKSSDLPQQEVASRISAFEPCKEVQGDSVEVIGIRLKNCIANIVLNYMSKDKEDFEYLYADMMCEAELNLKNFQVPLYFSDVNPIQEDNENYRKFFACSLTRRGVVSEDGKVNINRFDYFLDQLPYLAPQLTEEQRKDITKGVQHCKDVNGTSAGETGIKLKNCFAATLKSKVT